MLRDVVTSSGCLNNDAVTEALLNYANTKCRVLKKSPAEIAAGRSFKDFYPRTVSSLLPRSENMLTGLEKEKLQSRIRHEAGDRLSEHTRPLKPLQIGDWVQCPNLHGPNPLKSDYSGEIVGFHNEHSYAVKIQPGGRISVRNRATLRKIPKPSPIHLPVLEPEVSGPRNVVPGEPSVTRGAGSRNVDPIAPRVTRARAQGDRLAGAVLTPAEGRVSGSGMPGKPNSSGQRPEGIVDSGPSAERPGGVQRGHGASPGGQSAPLGRVQGTSSRSEIRRPSGVDSLAAQVEGRDQVAGPSQGLAGSALGGSKQVSQTEVRRSGRVKTKLIPYQAGQSGMEGSCPRSDTGDRI